MSDLEEKSCIFRFSTTRDISFDSVSVNLSQGIGDPVSSAGGVFVFSNLAIYVLSSSLARLILASLVNVVVSDFFTDSSMSGIFLTAFSNSSICEGIGSLEAGKKTSRSQERNQSGLPPSRGFGASFSILVKNNKVGTDKKFKIEKHFVRLHS